jgi:hypothetical protein
MASRQLTRTTMTKIVSTEMKKVNERPLRVFASGGPLAMGLQTSVLSD